MSMDLYVLYGILLAGAPVFGLEALTMAMRGSVSSISGGKAKILAVSTGLGLLMVGISIGLTLASPMDSLSPLFLSSILLALTFSLGWPVSYLLKRCGKRDEVRMEEMVSKDELKGILRERGFSDLMGEKEEDEPD